MHIANSTLKSNLNDTIDATTTFFYLFYQLPCCGGDGFCEGTGCCTGVVTFRCIGTILNGRGGVPEVVQPII